jgi:hypothetical protein
MKKTKSWQEKNEESAGSLYDSVGWKGRSKVGGKEKMLIPTPKLIEKYVKKIPYGKVITSETLRKKLAEDYQETMTYPLTTGIFLRIVAEASEEAFNKSGIQSASWWRALQKD